MQRVAPLMLFALLVGVADPTVSADMKADQRLSQRPIVAMPSCASPKPYHVENWTVTSNRFHISLVPTTAHDAAERHVRRIAAQYKFEIDGSLAVGAGGGYFFAVKWLDPAQVAALRCEEIVHSVDLVEEVQIMVSELRSVGA